MGRFVEVRGYFHNENTNGAGKVVRSLIINTGAIRWIDEKCQTVELGDSGGVWTLTYESMKRLRNLIDLVALTGEAVKPAAPYVRV